jgi:protease-4
MQSVYELFLRRVAEGRSLPMDAVRAVAEGRIWSGQQAHKLRLVDEIGGLGRALELARELGSLDADAPVRVEGLSEGILETLLLGENAPEAEVRAAIARTAEQRSLFSPLAHSLRPFVAALSPLLHGESIATALPFALVLR